MHKSSLQRVQAGRLRTFQLSFFFSSRLPIKGRGFCQPLFQLAPPPLSLPPLLFSPVGNTKWYARWAHPSKRDRRRKKQTERSFRFSGTDADAFRTRNNYPRSEICLQAGGQILAPPFRVWVMVMGATTRLERFCNELDSAMVRPFGPMGRTFCSERLGHGDGGGWDRERVSFPPITAPDVILFPSSFFFSVNVNHVRTHALPDGTFKLTSVTNLRKKIVTSTSMWYSVDMFHYMLKAEFVTPVSLKIPLGTSTFASIAAMRANVPACGR